MCVYGTHPDGIGDESSAWILSSLALACGVRIRNSRGGNWWKKTHHSRHFAVGQSQAISQKHGRSGFGSTVWFTFTGVMTGQHSWHERPKGKGSMQERKGSSQTGSTTFIRRLKSSPRAIVSTKIVFPTSGGGQAAKEGWAITF